MRILQMMTKLTYWYAETWKFHALNKGYKNYYLSQIGQYPNSQQDYTTHKAQKFLELHNNYYYYDMHDYYIM